jgi:hypothetical protein
MADGAARRTGAQIMKGSETDENITIHSSASMIAALILLGCGKHPSELEPIRPVRAIKVEELKAISSRECPEYLVYTLASIIITLGRTFLFRALIKMTEPGKFA